MCNICTEIMNIHLSGYLQSEHTRVTGTKIKKETLRVSLGTF